MQDFSVEIDDGSGFCFGVVNAINKAESELDKGSELYCLGDIVHNGAELKRLQQKGLKIVDYEGFDRLNGKNVLFRAHGEPPSTYETARKNGIDIVDATCPVVLQLQKRIREVYQNNPDCQIVIYGKRGHAEVNGLVGQTDNTAIVVEDTADLSKLDFGRDIVLFSQTTKSKEGFEKVKAAIIKQKCNKTAFSAYDTICKQVSGRMNKIKAFAASHDLVIFVGGLKSSNAKALFDACLEINEKSYFVSSPDELKSEWFDSVANVGVCGATSTPKWQMQEVRERILTLKQ